MLAQTKEIWMEKFKAAGIHLFISAIVAAVVAILVFFVWYPSPYRDLVGGRELFLIVIAVDVIMGPALTLVVFNRKKEMAHLTRDLATIAILQIAALGYGINTVLLARPVYVAFEIDRLKIVTVADIDADMLKEAAPEYRRFTLTGPKQIAAVKPVLANEQARSIDLAMSAGIDLAQQPGAWRPMDDQQQQLMWQKALPLQKFRTNIAPRGDQEITKLNAATHRMMREKRIKEDDVRVMALMSKRASATAFINKQGLVIDAVDIDMF